VPRQRRGLSPHLLLLADRLRRSAHRRPDPRPRPLRRAAAEVPAAKRVFPPPPPPGDPLETPFFKGGALNELALNATQDLHALRAMPREQAAQYINSRAYLFHRLCSCGTASKVASGTIQPDGGFNICWREPLHLLLPNCYEQYAYVVKQTIGGSTTTIYDGLPPAPGMGRRPPDAQLVQRLARSPATRPAAATAMPRSSST
jgi:hypothetical protein